MKYNIKYILTLVLTLSLFAGCSFSDHLNEDPNKATKFETSFLYLKAANEVYRFNWTEHQFMNNWYQLFPHYLAEAKEVSYTIFGNQNITTIGFFLTPIKNLHTIVTAIDNDEIDINTYGKLGDKENQVAVSLTLKAFYMMHLTDMLGMLPYSEAFMQTENGLPMFRMKYDTQEEIYNSLFDELNRAYGLFDSSKRLNTEYERLYKGDISKWKEFNASLRMMMAIKLQNAAPEKGKKEFSKAYKDGAITSNTSNLEFNFLNEISNNASWLYLLYNYSDNNYYAPCSTIMDQMKEYQDPRIPAYFEKNSDNEYVGATLGWTQDELTNSNRNFSRINKKYWDKPTSPITITSAANTLFMQAEAALIGWIDADPKEMYKAAIEASFIQHSVNTTLITDYLAHSEVAFATSKEEQIKQIAMQKWIAGYLQDGIEAWSDWRRFKYPDLKAGKVAESTGGLTQGLPLRMTYAENEIKYNMENYERVKKEQGKDNIYTKLWWNK